MAELDTFRKAPDPRNVTEWKTAVTEIVNRKKRTAFDDLIRDSPEDFERFKMAVEKIRLSSFAPASFSELVSAVEGAAQDLVEEHLSGVS